MISITAMNRHGARLGEACPGIAAVAGPAGIMIDPAAPLLFFDSGVGGLSVVAPTLALIPAAPIVYVADSAAFPYGTKSEGEIAARVPALLGRLAERFRPRLIVIACNTASTIALGSVRAALDVPIVGTVPAIKPAAAMSRTRAIGVLGTAATVRQPYVDDLVARFAGDCAVYRYGSAALVELAEAALAGEAPSLDAVAAELAGLFGQPGGERIDTIVNACTHFPLLEADMIAAAPPGVAFVDGGPGIARRVAALTQGQDWPDAAVPGRLVFTRLGERERAIAATLSRRGFGVPETL
jgi:glutamate racemase